MGVHLLRAILNTNQLHLIPATNMKNAATLMLTIPPIPVLSCPILIKMTLRSINPARRRPPAIKNSSTVQKWCVPLGSTLSGSLARNTIGITTVTNRLRVNRTKALDRRPRIALSPAYELVLSREMTVLNVRLPANVATMASEFARPMYAAGLV